MPYPINVHGGARDYALNRCRLFETSDLDEACSHISTFTQPHRLVPLSPAGNGMRYMDFLPLHHVGISAIRLGHVHGEVGTLDGYHIVMLCIAGQARMYRNGVETVLGEMRGMCISPGEAVHGAVSEDCEQLLVRVAPEIMDSLAGMRGARLAPDLDLRRDSIRPWLDFMRSIVSSSSTIEVIRRDDRIAARYEQLLVDLLISGQGLIKPASRGASAVPASVHRAEQYIGENFAKALTLGEISATAGVSPRTLLKHFRDFRQTSPMQYLRDVRLDQVRKQFLRDPGRNVSVIGMDAGLTHLGRLAREYSIRFGETPSQTRARARTMS